MIGSQTLAYSSAGWSGWSLERLFDAAGKDMVIRLRWPLVILSSYLLYYAESPSLTPAQLQALLILYLLSHAGLYFVADGLFASPYFCAPLLLFDTLVLLVVLEIGGAAAPDFFATCLLTLVLSCICQDGRGLLTVTFLAPLIYACIVFNSTVHFDPAIYLRLPFPFAIALFYGYFGQVERLRHHALAEQAQAQRQQQANSEISEQRQRLELLHEINLALGSAPDVGAIVDLLLNRALVYFPYTAALVRLRNAETGGLETVAAAGERSERLCQSKEMLKLIDRVAVGQRPLVHGNVFNGDVLNSGHRAQLDLFKAQGLKNIFALPLMAVDEAIGVLVVATREEHPWSAAEMEFFSTLAGQAAMALDRAQHYDRRRRLTAQLRAAQQASDDFLKSCSTELKTPLNMVIGYSEMFRAGLLGAMTPIQEKAMETIERQAKLLQGSIDALLLASNGAAEALHAEAHDLSLWDLCSELRAAYDCRSAKDVKLVWDYPIDLPEVRSYRGKLKQVAAGLIDNAIKCTHHGAISIAVKYASARQLVEIRIAANGGQQVDFSLGLYVVKKYLEMLGGSLEVESGLGGASTFTVQIPAPIAHQQLPLVAENNI